MPKRHPASAPVRNPTARIHCLALAMHAGKFTFRFIPTRKEWRQKLELATSVQTVDDCVHALPISEEGRNGSREFSWDYRFTSSLVFYCFLLPIGERQVNRLPILTWLHVAIKTRLHSTETYCKVTRPEAGLHPCMSRSILRHISSKSLTKGPLQNCFIFTCAQVFAKFQS